jgi:hypothetical protein
MNKVSKEHIDNILKNSEIHVDTHFGKLMVMIVKLPNGFTIVQSSGCVDPANYSYEIGYNCCLKRVEDELWKLEGYVLQSKLGEIK